MINIEDKVWIQKIGLANPYKTHSKHYEINKRLGIKNKNIDNTSEIYGLIYIIWNKVNGKLYVGKTTHTFKQRYNGSIRNTHNDLLKHDIEEYGEDAFVIDECICIAKSKKELSMKESYLIKLLKSTYYMGYGYNKKDELSPMEIYCLHKDTYNDISKNINSDDFGFYDYLYMRYGGGLDFFMQEVEKDREELENINKQSILKIWTIHM